MDNILGRCFAIASDLMAGEDFDNLTESASEYLRGMVEMTCYLSGRGTDENREYVTDIIRSMVEMD